MAALGLTSRILLHRVHPLVFTLPRAFSVDPQMPFPMYHAPCGIHIASRRVVLDVSAVAAPLLATLKPI